MGLLRLMPGVRYEDSGEALGEDFGTLIPQVGGQRRHWNSVSVDGLLGKLEQAIGVRQPSTSTPSTEGVAQHLQGGVRPERWRQHPIVTKSGGAATAAAPITTPAATPGMPPDGRTTNQTCANRTTFNTWRERSSPGPAGLWSQKDKKVFFFYSLEAPQGQRPPGPTRLDEQPASPRPADFHPRPAAQRSVQHPYGLLPRQHRTMNGAALLEEIFPLQTAPGSLNRRLPPRGPADHPRLNQVLRTDWKPSSNTSYFSTLRTFS